MDARALMGLDIGPEDLERLTKAIGAKLAELTGLPIAEAELLAISIACCEVIDEEP